MDSSSSHVNYSVKMGDDFSLNISEASSIEQLSTGSGVFAPETVDHQPSDEEDEPKRKHQPTTTTFRNTENTPNRQNSNSNKNEKYYHRKDDEVGNVSVLPSNMSYGEWKKRQMAMHSSSPVSSASGSAAVRVRSTAHRPQSTALSVQVEHSSSSARYLNHRNQEIELHQERLPIVTPPRSVASQASFASVSSGLTARMMNTSYFSVADDVHIRVGDKEFRHSRAILCYASKVLAQHIDGGTDELHIPHKSPSEWNELQAFLQPRSVQSAAITPRNLPALLPWFDQLELTVLLRECDLQLSRLQFATAIPEETSDNAVSHAVHELARAALGIRDSQQPIVPPCHQDAVDIILLARISGKVCLPLTRVMCLDVLQEYLDLPYLFLQLDEKQNFHSISTIASLIDLLDDEEVLDTVWPQIVSYLPEDLPFRDDQRELRKNPLFPYLLRAGFDKTWHESDDYSVAGTLDNRRAREMSDLETAPGPDPNVEVSFRGELYVKDAAHDIVNSNNEGHILDPMESLQYSFETWDNATSTPAKAINAKPLSKPNDHSNMESEHIAGLDIPPQDRSLWLNTIWRKLLEPPIFPDTSSNDPVETASHASEVRTFSC